MQVSLISIIIPTYNSSHTITDCLDSIYTQSIQNYELIIVDDGSTDNTINIITNYAQNHTNIRIITQLHQGVSVARNKGISQSRGGYIVFVDSDDTLEEDYLKHLSNACQDNKADIAVCNFRTITHEKKENNTIKQFSVISPKEYIAQLPQIFHGYLWNKMYSRSVLDGVKFDKNITYCEDFLFNLQVAQSAKKIVVIPEHLYNYTRTYQSVGATFDQKYNSSIIIAIEKIMEIIEQNYPNAIAMYAANFLPILYQQRFLARHNHLQPNPAIKILLRKYKSAHHNARISHKHKVKLYVYQYFYPLFRQYQLIKAKLGGNKHAKNY